MTQYKVVGIDLAKNVFQVCALNQAGKVAFNKRVSRKKLTALVQQLPPSTIAMEACGSANYWGRTFEKMGHHVRLIPAQYVKPFVKRQKNDAHDALAICEASQRPGIHDVPIKTIDQLDIQMIHRVRRRHSKSKTAIANQIRALLREYGIVIPVNLSNISSRLPMILEDAENGLSDVARGLLNDLYGDLKRELETLKRIDKELIRLAKQNEDCQRLMTIPGYGPVIATALVAAVGNGVQFDKGRMLAAWAGLTPRHHASGEKMTSLGTSKAGNPYLRFLLVQGARTVVNWSHRKDDRLNRWTQRIMARRGYNKAIVALANKCARIAWVVLTRKETFTLSQAH